MRNSDENDAATGEGVIRHKDGSISDAGFHEELLGPEEDDPFTLDLDEFANLSEEDQQRLLKERYGDSSEDD